VDIAIQVPVDADVLPLIDMVADLERAGARCVWVGESFGWDAFTALAAMAARTTTLQLGTGVVNTFSRTPATIAMTIASLDRLSGGRAICGLGASGPAVIEGLHGLAFQRPVDRLREYTEVCRMLWRGERLQYSGDVLQIPRDEHARGMRLQPPPLQQVPIWWAALGDNAVAAAATTADGWLPYLFYPERYERVWRTALDRGLAQRDPGLGPLRIAADCVVAIGARYADRHAAEVALEPHRRTLALHLGGMGPRGRNFYNTLAARYGFEAQAQAVQDLYLDGKRAAAAAAVPQELLEGTALVGDIAGVRDRLDAYRAAGVSMLNVSVAAPDLVRQVDLLATAIAA
jgi:F420-dependent oxidoreductase-like protein